MATATLCPQMTAATEHVAKERGVAKDVAKERGTLPNVKTLQKREAQANRADTSIVSTPCEVTSTSKAHQMVVVMVTMEAGITLTSRWPHRLSAEKPDEDAEMVLVSQAEKTRTMLKRKRNQEAEADAMEM